MAEKEVTTLGAGGIKTLARIMARYDMATLQKAKDEITSLLATVKNDIKAEILGGAPEDYDTLKEIAEYIEAHEDISTALIEAIGNKADKTTVDALTTRVATLEENADDYLTASDIAVYTDAEIEALVAEALAD